jgi:hypothetical protein
MEEEQQEQQQQEEKEEAAEPPNKENVSVTMDNVVVPHPVVMEHDGISPTSQMERELPGPSNNNTTQVPEHVLEQFSQQLKRLEVPNFVRLGFRGFHDCVGGCNCCVNMTNQDNRGLAWPI